MRIALVALLLTTGCLSTSPEQWSHTPDGQTLAKQAIYECRHDADQVAYQHTAFGGAVMPIIGLFARADVFKKCMESRGYRGPE